MSESSTPSASTASSTSSLSMTPPGTPPNMHQNTINPDAKWLVQKYGGTSVGKFAAKIAQDIVSEYIDQHKVAIVCSARSGSTKALGTTNLLIRAASEALQRTNTPSVPGTPGTATPLTWTNGFSSPSSPRSSSPSHFSSLSWSSATGGRPAPPFSVTVDIIRADHLSAARTSVKNQAILRDVEAEIERDCESLRAFLLATQVIDEISPRSKDSIIGFGEKLACKLMTAVLRDNGIDAEYVSLENVVPAIEDQESWNGSSPDGALDQSFYDNVAKAVGERLSLCSPRVPVVTGFFGSVPGSLLRQVGRGYTDLLAALAAVGLEASELQIWKEVDGIFTADPRKVPTARLIPIISPDEAAELTYYGSEVVHPFTMEQVIRRKIPIRIKNVENPKGGGTVIHPDPDIDSSQLQQELELDPFRGPSLPEPVSLDALHDLSMAADEHRHRRLPTAVTIKENIVVVNINSNRKSVSHGFLAGIFGTLDRFGVVVDLISTSEVHVSMAMEEQGLDKKVLERLMRELRKSGSVSAHREMAILSLVGKQMRNMVGIAGRMFATLAQGNVNIEMISQGASEINISCVIDGRDAVKALNLIHQSCLQIKPEGARGRVGPWLF